MELKIKYEEGKLSVQSEKQYSFNDLLRLSLNVVLGGARQVINAAPPDEQKEVAEELYDRINVAASSLLDTLIPEKELRPDLTAEAIKLCEDQIMQKEIDNATNSTNSNIS